MRRVEVSGPRGTVWLTDIPATHRGRRRGLRGQPPSPRRAMLFARCRSIHTVGMRGPITVAFLDGSMRVIRVVRARAGRVLVCPRSRHVLECNVGADVRVGDRLSLRPAPGERAIRDGPGTGRPGRT